MDEQKKTVLFGLQLRRAYLKKKLKKAERKLNNMPEFSDEETVADCERLDIIEKLNDIEEEIKSNGGNLDD